MAHAFCRTESIAAGEPLAGTGAIFERILLLAWPRRHWRMPRSASVGVSPVLGAAIDRAISAKVHLVLIDNPEGSAELPALLLPREGIVADFDDQAALARAIDHYAQGGSLEGRREERTLILCCTDSRRDACCARFGQATFRALLNQCDPERHLLLQASHLGGCRFAASLMVFPHHHRYGRLEPEAVSDFLAHLDAGRPFLPSFRGHADLPADRQVAEIAALEWAAARGLDAGSPLPAEQLAASEAEARYRFTLAERTLTIAVERKSQPYFGTCGGLKAGKALMTERWVAHAIGVD
ncbi:MAG: sucrase ferredoxin [Devosia sp.]